MTVAAARSQRLAVGRDAAAGNQFDQAGIAAGLAVVGGIAADSRNRADIDVVASGDFNLACMPTGKLLRRVPPEVVMLPAVV